MATLYITEYAALSKDARGDTVMVGKEPAITIQTVTTSGTAASSSAFGNDTRFVRVWSTAKEHLNFSTTATTSHTPIAAETPEYFGVDGGGSLSAING